MLPPSRGRVIFCDSRDNDGACGVIHRRNVTTPPGSFDKIKLGSEALLAEACQSPMAEESDLLAACQPVKKSSSSGRGRRHLLPKLIGNPGHGTPTSEQHFPATPSQILTRAMPSTPDPLQTPIRMITPDHFSNPSSRAVSTPDNLLRPSRASTCTPDHLSHPSRAGTCTPDHLPNPSRVCASKSEHLSNFTPANASTADHLSHPPRICPSKSDHMSHPSRTGASTPDHLSYPIRPNALTPDHMSHPCRTGASTPDHLSHPSRTNPSTPDHSSHPSHINAATPDHPPHPSEVNASTPTHLECPSRVCASKSDHQSNFTPAKALTLDHLLHPSPIYASKSENTSHPLGTNASAPDYLPYPCSQSEAPAPEHVRQPQHRATPSAPHHLAATHESAPTPDHLPQPKPSTPDQTSRAKVSTLEPGPTTPAHDEPIPGSASSGQMPSGRPPRPDSGHGVLRHKGLRELGSPLDEQVLCARYSPSPIEGTSPGEKGQYEDGTPGRINMHDFMSPMGLRPSSSVGTPLSGLPLSPEHEMFRRLSDSPSNSIQGKRRCYLDLKSWKQGEMLGRGSSGEVYKAMCGGQFLAVKKIRLKAGTTSTSAKEAENLRAEIELLKQLNHPRIVRYTGCQLEELECGGLNLLIFLEYMPSGSLSSVLKRFGPYGLPLAKKYTRQILEGLAFLHSKGIVHRDVKGANVLVDHMGEAKLADFGACKQLEALHSTLSGGLCEVKGSVFWMAPEMVTGTAGRRSDIWSTGCVVIEMLTARPPWTLHRNVKNWSLPQALQYIIESNEIPPIPENCDRKCHDFLLQCLVREHRKRPYAHKLLSHEFLRVEEKQ